MTRHPSRRRAGMLLRLDSLEPRTLLSSSPVGGNGHLDGTGGTQVVVQNGITPITDLSGNPLSIAQVVGLPAVQTTDFDALQRLLPAVQRGHSDSLKFASDVATLTSASTPIKLRGYTVSIDWGDGTAPTKGTLVVDRKTGVIHVKGAHIYQAVGTFSITVTLTQTTKNPDGTTSSQTLTMISTDTVTQDSADGLDIAATTGQPFTGPVGNFSSPGSTDPTTFTALINWGDGSKVSLGAVSLNADGTFSVGGTHTYATAGSYRISVFVYQRPPAGVLHASQDNHGLHLGWRHRFVEAIFSTATVTDPAPPPPPVTPATTG